MRATSIGPLVMVLGLLTISANIASAQFRIAPAGGGFSGSGVYGPPAGLGSNSGFPDLGSGLGHSGFSTTPFTHDDVVLPDSNSTVNPSGGGSGGSPPPPDDPRWNGVYVAPPSDQLRDNTGTGEAKSIEASSTDATTKEPSGWRWKWWHGLIVLVILGVVMAAGKR